MLTLSEKQEAVIVFIAQKTKSTPGQVIDAAISLIIKMMTTKPPTRRKPSSDDRPTPPNGTGPVPNA